MNTCKIAHAKKQQQQNRIIQSAHKTNWPLGTCVSVCRCITHANEYQHARPTQTDQTNVMIKSVYILIIRHCLHCVVRFFRAFHKCRTKRTLPCHFQYAHFFAFVFFHTYICVSMSSSWWACVCLAFCADLVCILMVNCDCFVSTIYMYRTLSLSVLLFFSSRLIAARCFLLLHFISRNPI